jgi:hypothetical protein
MLAGNWRGRVAAAAVSLVLAGASDWLVRESSVSLDGVWGALALEGFAVERREGAAPGAVGDRHSAVVLPVAAANAPVELSLYLTPAWLSPVEAALFVNGAPAGSAVVSRPGQRLSVQGRASGAGVVRLQVEPRIVGKDKRRPRFSLEHALAVRQLSCGTPALPRLALYALLVGLALVWSAALGRLWPVLATGVTLALALWSAKAIVVLTLPACVATGVAATGLLLVARRCGLAPTVAAAVAAAFWLRLGFALQPAFPSVDSVLHSHRLETFMAGRLVTNIVGSGVERSTISIPYPPLAYAVLSPLAGVINHVRLTRVAPAVLEGTAPLLVFAVARAAGASPAVAQCGALALAMMPEGLLVVAKGVLANASGLYALLCAVAAVLSRRWALWVPVGLWTLTCLGHPGITFGATALAGLWVVCLYAARAQHPPPLKLLAVAAVGFSLAWLVYYREAWGVGASSLATLRKEALVMPECFFAFRWINAGKLVQDLVLKFGAFVPFAWSGLRSRSLPPALRSLLLAWFAAGGIQVAMALLTPVAFRFEYFLAPAIALSAGVALAQRMEEGRASLVWAASLVSLGLQLALGVLLLYGLFDPINVIIPSYRWPLIGEGWGGRPGCDPSWPLV